MITFQESSFTFYRLYVQNKQKDEHSTDIKVRKTANIHLHKAGEVLPLCIKHFSMCY